jgi:hypothetical protein
MATFDEITEEKQQVSEALARVDAERENLIGQLGELEAAERVLARYSKGTGPRRRASGKAAATPTKTRSRQARRIEPRRSGPCPGNRQDATGNHRCVQGRSPEPCRRRHCPA